MIAVVVDDLTYTPQSIASSSGDRLDVFRRRLDRLDRFDPLAEPKYRQNKKYILTHRSYVLLAIAFFLFVLF